MFCMTIVFGTSPVPWTLLFRTQESYDSARTAYNTPALTDFHGKKLELTDDYGQQIILDRSSIHGVMFEDMSKSKMAHIERGIHQMKVQVEANNLAKTDPMLVAAMRSNMGQPGVITPFAANGAFRQ